MGIKNKTGWEILDYNKVADCLHSIDSIVFHYEIMPPNGSWRNQEMSLRKKYFHYKSCSNYYFRVEFRVGHILILLSLDLVVYTSIFKFFEKELVANIASLHSGGRVNLNFLALPYGVAFFNPWNIPNKIWESLNSKIKFEIHSINW